MRDQIHEIDFWSGNRSSFRRIYERDVLMAVLSATRDEFGDWNLMEHTHDYPGNKESGVFSTYGHDLFVTTAGNRKLSEVNKIMVQYPILNRLLGYRVLIIRKEDKGLFAQIDTIGDLKKYTVGIPELWTDAELMRYNGFTVNEGSSFDTLFENLCNGEFAFTTLGVNEVDSVFVERADEVESVVIVDHLLIYYPLPLLFYVHPDQPVLAERISRGMRKITNDSTLNRLFREHNKEILEKVEKKRRRTIRLENPLLPNEITDSVLESDTKNSTFVPPY